MANYRVGAFWTEEKVRQLREGFEKDLSAAQICKIIGANSRSMVIGKLHRLKLIRERPALNFRWKDHVKKPKGSRLPTPVILKATDLVPLTINDEVITEENIKRGMCRYPYGDPQKDDFRYCGHPVGKGPYCPSHHVACFVPMPPRRASQ